MIKIYTLPTCFHCKDAVRQLKEAEIEFEELDASEHLSYIKDLGFMELPMITIGEKLVRLEDVLNYEE